MSMRFFLNCALAAGGLLLAGAAAAQAPVPARLHADGALVIDTRAKIAWPRCVEGMHWDGKTCTGRASLLTYAQAKALATQRWKADGVRWRLPRVAELRRLVDRSAHPPAVDPVLFPNAPGGWHWTGTSSVNAGAVNPYAYENAARGGKGGDELKVQHAWAVDMDSAKGRGDMPRGTALPVRLLRPAP